MYRLYGLNNSVTRRQSSSSGVYRIFPPKPATFRCVAVQCCPTPQPVFGCCPPKDEAGNTSPVDVSPASPWIHSISTEGYPEQPKPIGHARCPKPPRQIKWAGSCGKPKAACCPQKTETNWRNRSSVGVYPGPPSIPSIPPESCLSPPRPISPASLPDPPRPIWHKSCRKPDAACAACFSPIDEPHTYVSKKKLVEAIGERIEVENSILQFCVEKPPYEELYQRSPEVIEFLRKNYQSESPLITKCLLASIDAFYSSKDWDTDKFLSLKLLKHKLPDVLMLIWDHFVAQNYLDLDGDLASDWRQIAFELTRIITNMSNISSECAKDIVKIGFFQKLLFAITLNSISIDEEDSEKFDILANVLITLYNCIRWCLDEAKPIFRQNKGVETMLNLRQLMGEVETFKRSALHALLCIVYTLDETEQDLVNEDTKTNLTTSMCNAVCEAVKSDDRMFDYTSLTEYVDAINILLVSDVRKLQLCSDSTMFDCIATAIDTNDQEMELIALVRCLYLLTFIDEGKKQISANQQLMKVLETLKNHNNNVVTKIAEGIMWNVSGQRPTKLTTVESSQPHVMISYDWNHQHIATEINFRLKSLGYLTWIDVERMRGSTLEAMATAIEQSAVILVCFSESYKTSPNCRLEAEYAQSLAKQIVPIKTDPNYKAYGWLGIILGSKLYHKCDTADTVDSMMPNLIKELGNRGKLGQMQIGESTFENNNATVTKSHADTISKMSSEELKRNFDRLGWEWLIEDLNGSEFVFLHQSYLRSMEEFQRTLREDFGFKQWKIRFQFADFVVQMSKLCCE